MKINSHNLVMSAMFGGRRGPRPAAGNPTSIACHGLMEKAGIFFPEAHLNPEAMAGLALAGHEVVGFDTVMPEYSVVQEAAALGARVDWGDRDKMPDVKDFPNADFSDIVMPPDFLEKPSCRVVLDAISILRRQVGGRVAIIGKVMGPWTLSYHMAGTQNFLLAVGMGESDKVSRMLRQLIPVSVAFINAQFAAGADIVVLADHATRNLVGPHHYKEYLLPIHQEIMGQVGGPIILHVCGNCSDRLELFAETGVDAYHFEWQVDSREAVQRIGSRVSLAGNINNAQVLLQGTPEDVYKQARYAIDAGVHLIGPECAIPLSTPIENLRAIVAAVREGYRIS
jgi:[methyl-Co(III) methanol-specific corrinoid protein]:coenzyme M methyltransferase